MVNHDTITMLSFFCLCINAKEIKETYNIKTDEELRNFFKDNFEDEYGYYHKFFIVNDNNKLYTVDELLFPSIKKLNENGYLTRFSCQGSKTGRNGYISFDKSLSRETRLVLQKLAFNMIKQGLVVNIDSNFLNPNERPIIRFSINSISDTYDESRWALCNGRKDKLLNQAVFFATSMLCGDKDDAGIAIKEMKKFNGDNV